MIVTLKSCPDNDGIALVAAPVEMNQVMGGFASARFDLERKGYLIEDKHVPAFERYIKHTGNRLVDDRKAARTTPGTWVPEPLPECVACGAPARRTTSARLSSCPSCGQSWVPVTFRDDRARAARNAVPPNAAFRASLGRVEDVDPWE